MRNRFSSNEKTEMDEDDVEFGTDVRFKAERHPERHSEVDASDPDWWDAG